MATCGINVNLNNLQGELQTKITGFLDLKGSLGTAAGLDALAAKLPTGLASIKAQVTSMVPEIPNVSGFLSLRSELASLSIMSIGTPAALSKLASISSNFGGLTSLSGFANINLNDLASSAFSLSGSFDPCSIDIPNIVMDPSGLLESLPAEPPDIGATIAAAKISLPDRVIVDDLKEATKNNIEIVESMDTSAVEKAIESNVSTSITGMGDMVKKIPTGEPVVETKNNFVERVKVNSLPLMDEEPEIAPPVTQPKAVYTPHPDYYISASGDKVYYKRIMRYDRLDRRAKLMQFKADNPTMTRGKMLVEFNKQVNSGKIEVLQVRS
jgi:hypothetical protein